MAHILVIEDETVMLCLISSTLRLDGHSIIGTRNPIEALSIIEQREHEIDLVFTNVDMKQMSGFEFVKRINQKRVNIPVLFMSACGHVAGVISSTMGRSSVIEKPFTAQDLRRGVAKFLAKQKRRTGGPRELSGDERAA